MAQLYYGTDTSPVTLPDRLLAYVKVIITTKLRRNESFTLTWSGEADTVGRSTIWLQPAIALRFVFDSAEPVHLVGDYVRALADQANAASGLVIDVSTWEDAERAATAPPVRRVPAARTGRALRAA